MDTKYAYYSTSKGYRVVGGTAAHFLKADGSVDSNGYVNKTGDTMSGALLLNGNFIVNSGNTVLGSTTSKGFVPASGSVTSEHNAVVTNNNQLYGLAFGSLTGGAQYIQANRFDGTTTNYELQLNPNGGRVRFGGDISSIGNELNLQRNGVSRLRSSGLNTVLSSEGSGQIYLRPQGDAITGGQIIIDSTGVISTASTGSSTQWYEAFTTLNSVPRQGIFGGNINSVRTLDTRNTNPLPSTDLRSGIWFDFKTSSVIGLTGGGTYSAVITMIPYQDNSGNINTAFRLAQSADDLFFQNFTASGTWGTFRKVWSDKHFSQVNINRWNNDFVPYTGATADLTLADKNINFTSGSISKNENLMRTFTNVFQKLNGGVSTGIISFKFPLASPNNTMFDVTINMYGYSTGTLAKLRLSFYKNSATTLTLTGSKALWETSDVLPSTIINVGLDTSNNICINLGEITTVWNSWTHFEVEKVKVGHNGYNADWSKGWSQVFETVVPVVPDTYQSIISIVPDIVATRSYIENSMLQGRVPDKVNNLATTDLNTVLTPGFYSQLGDVNATPSRNYPVQNAGSLNVYKSVTNGVIQEYSQYNTPIVYRRIFNGTTWLGWRTTLNNIDPIPQLTTFIDKVGGAVKSTLTFVSPSYATTGILRLNLGTNGYAGYLKIKLTGSYASANVNGYIEVTGGFGGTTTAIWNNSLKCITSLGVIRSAFYIDPIIKRDASDGQYYIEIHKKSSASNQVFVEVESRSIISPSPIVLSSSFDASATVTSLINEVVLDGSITANSIIKSGGLPTQFLKADGSVDSNSYVLQSGLIATLANYATLNDVQTFTNTITFDQAPLVPWGTLAYHAVALGQMTDYVDNASGDIINYVTNNFIPKTHVVNGITTTKISNWDSAYSFTSNFATNYNDLVAIENLVGVDGYLRKDGNGQWSLTQSPIGDATSTNGGRIKLFSDTVQSITASAVSATASRTYGIQLNSSGQMVVNVPWVDTNTVYTLPTATSSILGSTKLGSDTVQSVVSNSVTAIASRTYSTQVNSAGQLVVNIPWVDTNTTYINGTGLSLSGTTFSVNYGTTTGTSAQGNDSRILNGQTAFGYGDHAQAGYAKLASAQTFTGTNTFSVSPMIPNATLPVHPVNLGQLSGILSGSYVSQNYLENNFIKTPDGYTVLLSSSTNLNDNLKTGFYRGEQLVNAPNSNTGWWFIAVESHDPNWRTQKAISYGVGNVSNLIYQRTMNNGVWSAWAQIWSTQDFTVTNIQQWNYMAQYGLQLNSEFTINTGSGLVIADDNVLGYSGMIDNQQKAFVAGKIGEYYKYGSSIKNGLEGINYHREKRNVGIGGDADSENKVRVQGCVKALENFKSKDERPDTMFIPNGETATLRDEIINDESEYAIRLDPHEYEIDSSGSLEVDDRNRLIHVIGEQIKMVVNFRKIYPKQQIVIYNFDQNGGTMAVKIQGKTIANISARGFLRLYVTKSLRVIAERQQPCDFVW